MKSNVLNRPATEKWSSMAKTDMKLQIIKEQKYISKCYVIMT